MVIHQIQETTETVSHEWPQILLMEDETSVGQGLQMVLTEEGYVVDLVTTGQSALDTFYMKEFDLLVADLKLPDIDGMEVIKKVKKGRPDTGVIVITGYSTVSSAVEAMKLGACDYLSKPFTEDEIKSAVKVALKGKEEALKRKRPDVSEAVKEKAVPVHVVEKPKIEDNARVEKAMSEIRSEFKGRPDELIPILQGVQDKLGYLPENALIQIAQLTKVPSASVFGVASFYEQFRLSPVGKNIVKVCRGTACHVRGGSRILEELEKKLGIKPGENTDDLEYTLETVACFGACALAPIMVINDRVYGKMTVAKGKSLISNCKEE
jgi:NADH-quinone oxidoreductase subunit E